MNSAFRIRRAARNRLPSPVEPAKKQAKKRTVKKVAKKRTVKKVAKKAAKT